MRQFRTFSQEMRQFRTFSQEMRHYRTLKVNVALPHSKGKCGISALFSKISKIPTFLVNLVKVADFPAWKVSKVTFCCFTSLILSRKCGYSPLLEVGRRTTFSTKLTLYSQNDQLYTVHASVRGLRWAAVLYRGGEGGEWTTYKQGEGTTFTTRFIYISR